MAPSQSIDDLVQNVVCYNTRPLVFHGYLAPFFILQASIYYYLIYPFQEVASKDSNNSTNVTNTSNDTLLAGTQNSTNVQQLTNTLGDEANSSRHSYELWVIFAVVSVGLQAITYLFCHWSVDVKCWLSYNKCRDPFQSKYAKVTPTPNNGSTELVLLKRETIAKKSTLSFSFQKTKYTFNDKTNQFETTEFPCNRSVGFYKQWKGYTNPDELQLIDRLYGRNELDMVIPEFKELFIERATAPFFVFQIFCVGLWCLDEFMYYTLFTLAMLVTFEVVLVKHQLRNMQEIRRMGNQPYTLQVFRQNKWKSIKSDQLVCGDLINIVRSEHNIPCDILLLKGSCIIDESSLTGESIPQMKESIENIDDDERKLDINQDKLHILFGGTKVLQHSSSGGKQDQACTGYVLKCGFNTSQGKLLRTILFGVKRVTANNFETFCFIMFLLVFAIASACYVWNKGIEDPKKSRYRLFFECTMIITSVIPPELPIELSLAVNSSIISLAKLFIYCTEPFRIPYAGKVEYCCFDKTGTLTSSELIVEGVAGIPDNPHDVDATPEHTEEIKDTKDKKVSKTKIASSIPLKSSPHKPLTSEAISKHPLVTSIDNCPIATLQVLASCHSLAYLDEELVGDPLEKKVLEAISWNYSKSGVVTPKKGRGRPLKIHQRFHFNSTLKRMSVVSSFKLDLTNDNVYIASAKGAPEFMKPLMKNLPDNYDEVYLTMSRLGARVLALGYKTIGQIDNKDLMDMKREQVESDLMFAGLLVISCPLKPDSLEVCIELAESGHRLVMITGDGAITACHVARELKFITKEALVLSKVIETNDNSGTKQCARWVWQGANQDLSVDFEETCDSKRIIAFARKYDLCLTGDSYKFIVTEQKERFAYDLICRIKVFARVSPKQKENIVTTLKSRGKTVLMCGDGTNDVGALKHAHAGVALLSSTATSSQPKQVQQTPQQVASRPQQAMQPLPRDPRFMTLEERRRQQMLETQKKLKEFLEETDRPQFVKLGDASIAAPFTSRLSSTRCISHIIKQGRCTLVTTLQMFKILALNAILSAYCHSVLYMDGIKFSDAQFTLQGILNTFCFLFISWSKPLNKLSAQRPLPNIFNMYTILTVTLQSAIHFSSLIFLMNRARNYQELLDAKQNATLLAATTLDDPLSDQILTTTTLAPVDVANSTATTDSGLASLHTEFKASLINSTIFIIWMSVQIATFVVNYKGHPFMQSLRNNKPLCYCFMFSTFIVVSCVFGWSPSLNEQMSVVEFPSEYKNIVVLTIFANFVAAYTVDRICEYAIGRLKLEPL